jgi:hypothetical protein
MRRQPLVRFNNGVYIDQRQQDAVQGTLAPIQSSQIVFGALITADVVSGDNFIQHNLGRDPVLWILAGVNAVVDLYENTDNNFKDRQIIINSSGPATIRLWVA